MIGQTVSHYKIQKELGEGGMGVVYMAEDTHLGRKVAVKFLLPKSSLKHEYRARFLREARAVSVLSHPNIATVFDYGEAADGAPFIVMELVEGRTLGDLLRNSELTLGRSIKIIGQVAEALAEAHSHGIVHRDIKPSNVIVTDSGQAKVLDFGLAKQCIALSDSDADPEARTLLNTDTKSGVVVGTPLYLSPEQAVSGVIDGRSDLFAVGSLLYECVAGRPAFSGASLLEIGAQVIHIDPPLPSTLNPHVPKELDRVIMKALAKRADARYQNAEELLNDLRKLSGTLREDSSRTQRFKTIQKSRDSGALVSIAGRLGKPTLSIGFLLFVVSITAAVILSLIHFWSGTVHQPTASAVRWYKAGLSALNDGAYYQASKALEQAVNSDQKYALAHARLAEAWTELDYTEKAKDEMLQVASLVPDRRLLPEVDRLYLNAITSTATRDFAGAVAAYEAIASKSPGDAQVLLDLGRAYEKNEQTEKAIEAYQSATQHDPEYAPAFLRLGILYGRKQDLAKADIAFGQANALYKTLGNFEGLAEILYQRGALLTKQGNVPEARAFLQSSLEMARTAGNEYQQIKALLQLSNVEVSANDGALGERLATQAVELARTNGMENLTTKGLVDLGNAFFVRGDYAQAEKYFNQALDFAERNKGTGNQARALVMLGSLNMQLNRSDEAVRYSSAALALYEKGSYRREASQALLVLGHANRLKGDYDAAMQAFEQQLQIAETLGDQSQAATSHEAIGTVLEQKEQFGKALDHFNRKYELSKALGNQRGVAYGLTERGTVLWQLGRYEDARAQLGEAAALASRPGGNKALMTEIGISIAEMLMSQRSFSAARREASEALRLTGAEAKDIESRVKVITGLVEASSGTGNAGHVSCEQALGIANELHDPWLISRAQLALAIAFYEEGNFTSAREMALRATEVFSKTGQADSEWRAWAVAALASNAAKDVSVAPEYASHARASLARIRQDMGDEFFATYQRRPDVQYLQRLLADKTVNP